MKRFTWWAPALLMAAPFAAGCAHDRDAGDSETARIAISVTEKGFEPATVTVPAGKPVTLVVTRRTDRTCAKDFVMGERGIRRALPLDQAVEISFTPEKPGDLRYACDMDMIAGTVRVE